MKTSSFNGKFLAFILAVAGFGPLPGYAQQSAPTAAPATEANSTYLRDVLPIFAGKCSRCHNQESRLGNWLDYKAAFKDRREIRRRVWDSWKGHYYKQTMPAGNGPEALSLSAEERALIKEWVDSGAACGSPPAETNPSSKPERLEKGKRLFATVCAACHQSTGLGIPDKFPPLAGSDFLNADKNRAIKILLHGRQGELTVNGRKFNNSMPSFPFSDDEIASALTFVYSSFGNSGKDVTATEVKAMRAEKEEATPVQPVIVAHNATEQSPFE
jgi:mono/diheme cytochrome c family protein